MNEAIYWSVVWGDWQSKLSNDSTEYSGENLRVFNDVGAATLFQRELQAKGLEPTLLEHYALAISSLGVGVLNPETERLTG